MGGGEEVKPTSKRVNLDSTIGTEHIHHRSSEGRGGTSRGDVGICKRHGRHRGKYGNKISILIWEDVFRVEEVASEVNLRL
jgi:hypothetical protein